MNKKEIIDELNHLLHLNYDAEKGYQLLADKVDNESLADFFKNYAAQRYNFGHDIKAEITKRGESPDKGTSLKGDIHRTVINLKSVIHESDEAILNEAIRGEKKAVEDYEIFMKADNIDESIVDMVVEHRMKIKEALQRLERIEADLEVLNNS